MTSSPLFYRLAPLVVAGGLLVSSACGEDAEPPKPTPAESVTRGNNDNTPVVSYEYFDNGTARRTVEGAGNYTVSVVMSCQGPDLVEDVEGSWASSAISRSPDHAACADGKLIPEDFVLPK